MCRDRRRYPPDTRHGSRRKTGKGSIVQIHTRGMQSLRAEGQMSVYACLTGGRQGASTENPMWSRTKWSGFPWIRALGRGHISDAAKRWAADSGGAASHDSDCEGDIFAGCNCKFFDVEGLRRLVIRKEEVPGFPVLFQPS
jgi:hypothetical protein